jgi:hypothetical protein
MVLTDISSCLGRQNIVCENEMHLLNIEVALKQAWDYSYHLQVIGRHLPAG